MAKAIDGEYGYSYTPYPMDDIYFKKFDVTYKVYQLSNMHNILYTELHNIIQQWLYLDEIVISRNGKELNLKVNKPLVWYE